jgi:stage IV sporulation protein FB
MNTLSELLDTRWGELSFRLFGAPVYIKIWFWLVALVIGGEQEPVPLLIWLSVCFVSVLLHEFGHVAALRLFGSRSEVVLTLWGGATIPDRSPGGTLARFVVAVSGSALGFCVAALALEAAHASGAMIQFGLRLYLPTVLILPAGGHASYLYVLLNYLVYVNLYWGLVNLLPVNPLDGGHAAQAIFEQRDPWEGRRKSLMLSAVVAAAVAILGILSHSMYQVLAFGIMAALSAQAMEGERRRPPHSASIDPKMPPRRW